MHDPGLSGYHPKTLTVHPQVRVENHHDNVWVVLIGAGINTYQLLYDRAEVTEGLAQHIATAIEAETAPLRAEIQRLKWRLNHQTEDDAEMCRQGKHKDCGK